MLRRSGAAATAGAWQKRTRPLAGGTTTNANACSEPDTPFVILALSDPPCRHSGSMLRPPCRSATPAAAARAAAATAHTACTACPPPRWSARPWTRGTCCSSCRARRGTSWGTGEAGGWGAYPQHHQGHLQYQSVHSVIFHSVKNTSVSKTPTVPIQTRLVCQGGPTP